MTLTIETIDSTDSLLHRHPANPILASKDWPYRINSVFNAGATLLPDGYHAPALPRRGSPRSLPSLHRALGERYRRVENRSNADAHAGSGSNIRKNFGASKIRVSPMFQSFSSMLSRTRRTPKVVPEFLLP